MVKHNYEDKKPVDSIFLKFSVFAALPISLEMRHKTSLYNVIDAIYTPYMSGVTHKILEHYSGITSVNEISLIDRLLIGFSNSIMIFGYFFFTSFPVIVLIYLLLIIGEYLWLKILKTSNY